MTQQQRIALAIAGSLLVGFLVFLLLPGNAINKPNEPLQSAEIERYLQSLPDVQHFSEDMRLMHQPQLFNYKPPARAFTPIPDAIATIKKDAPAKYAELETTVSKYGFTSVDAWVASGLHITEAYEKLVMEQLTSTPEPPVSDTREKVIAAFGEDALPPLPPAMEGLHQEMKKQQVVIRAQNKARSDANDADDPDMKTMCPFMDRYAAYKNRMYDEQKKYMSR